MLKKIIESLLFYSNQPLTLDKMQAVFPKDEKPTQAELKEVITSLINDYQNHAFELKCLASGYCIQIRQTYSEWVTRLQLEKPSKYSRAVLETLAIIAYRQPVTRADIEDIRGVAVNSTILRTLLEREWICVKGYRDVPGKPALYGTTTDFLNDFNLTSISQLPPLPPLDTITHEQ